MKNKQKTKRIGQALDELLLRNLCSNDRFQTYRPVTNAADSFSKADKDSEDYECQQNQQAASDFVSFGLILRENQNEIQQLREELQNLEKTVHDMQALLKKTKKKLKNQSDKIDKIQKKNGKQKAKIKKLCQQSKLAEKTIIAMGSYIGVSRPADKLKLIRKKIVNQNAAFSGNNRKTIIDAEYKEVSDYD